MFTRCLKLRVLGLHGIKGNEINTSVLAVVTPLADPDLSESESTQPSVWIDDNADAEVLNEAQGEAVTVDPAVPPQLPEVLCPELEELNVTFLGMSKKVRSILVTDGQNFCSDPKGVSCEGNEGCRSSEELRDGKT